VDLNELLVNPIGVQTWRLGESELLTSTTELSQRHLLEPVEGSVPDAENVELNELFATVVGGRGLLKANLDAETMEMLQSALSALSKPRPSEDGPPDKRSPARRPHRGASPLPEQW